MLLANNEQVIIQNNNTNYESITKEYRTQLKSNTFYKKKIRYNNPEDNDKLVRVFTTDPVVKIKKEEILIGFKTSENIRFSIMTPETLGIYKLHIFVENRALGKIEEVLRFIVEVIK